METLIFCHENDLPMQSLYHLLQSAHREVLLVTDKDLALAKSWNHGCNKKGDYHTSILLIDGILIQFEKVKCIINRIVQIPMMHFIHTQDRMYADMEMYALFLSLLKSNEDKLLQSFGCQHISNMQRVNRFFLLHQFIQAGLPIQSSEWTTDPTINEVNLDMIPFELKQFSTEHLRKKNYYEMLRKEPTVFREKIDHVQKVECVCSDIVSKIELKEYEPNIRNLLDSLGYVVATIKYGYSSNGLCFSGVDLFPKTISTEALEMLQYKIILKINQYDTRRRHTVRVTNSVGY